VGSTVTRFALIFGLFVLAGPPCAVAAWGPPAMLSPPGVHSDYPELAVGQSGDAVLVWRDRAVQTRVRSATGKLSAQQELSGPDADFPRVAVGPNGDAVVVWRAIGGTMDCGWEGCIHVQARARSADGALSEIQNLSATAESPTPGFDPQVGVDRNGNAVFAWVRGVGGEIVARARTAEGILGEIETVSAGPAFDPRVSVDPGGTAVFVWVHPDETTGCGGYGCDRVQARSRSADGTLSATQTLSSPGEDAIDPQVGIDRGGNAVVVWGLTRSTRCARFADGACGTEARVRAASGELSAIRTLSRSSTDGRVAVDATGKAAFVWLEIGRTGRRIETRSRSATGALTRTRLLSRSSGETGSAQVAVDSDGNAVFVWLRQYQVEARALGAAGRLTPTQPLSASGSSAFRPRLGIAPSGSATAAWMRLDGTTQCLGEPFGCPRIEAASGP
jgi:hypothetical protein